MHIKERFHNRIFGPSWSPLNAALALMLALLFLILLLVLMNLTAQPVKGQLGACLLASAVLLNTGHFACAARTIVRCDAVADGAAQSFGSSPNNPNPFGDVRGRLGNLFYTINTRIGGNPPNPTWPLTSAPPACEVDHDD